MEAAENGDFQQEDEDDEVPTSRPAASCLSRAVGL